MPTFVGSGRVGVFRAPRLLGVGGSEMIARREARLAFPRQPTNIGVSQSSTSNVTNIVTTQRQLNGSSRWLFSDCHHSTHFSLWQEIVT